MKRTFRNFKIQRTCTKKLKPYAKYKEYLQEDFHSRCAYCNLLDTAITTPFEVDHFIPRDAFKDEWPELDTTYENLVYACKKCNIAKGKQYQGNIYKGLIENELFYDPEKTDYDEIFYRDDIGSICSDDIKGRDMINRIKLYRPIHNLAWLCVKLNDTCKKLDAQIEMIGKNSERGKLLNEAKLELKSYYSDCLEVFIANYNNNAYVMKVDGEN